VAGDSVDGGAGTDTIQISTVAQAAAISAAANANITTVEIISAANATVGLTIDLSNQTETFSSISGGSGNDVIVTHFANNTETVNGGAGTDTLKVTTAAEATNVSNAVAGRIVGIEVLDFSGVNAAVTVSMGNMLNTSNYKYIGTAFADNLSAHNTLASTTGDTLVGGAGNDTLAGGTGHDTFAFEATAAGNGLDRITGFTKTGAAFDTLQVSSFLTSLNTTNLFSNGTTTANIAATAYDQHVVLINSTADLSTTLGFNSVFGAGAGHLSLLTSDTQKAVLIEGATANGGTDKMYYVTHDAQGTHVTQVANLVGVSTFIAGTDVHVA
jgi:Ca2+-binding RTX toxin-like protein